MNKVFKVIWSKAKSAWIVVSEFAKNHDAKSGSCHDGRKGNVWLVRLVMLMLVLGSTVIMPAYAADNGTHFVSVTKNRSTDNDDSLTKAGNYSNDGAQGTQSTAIGVNAKAQTQGTALGNGANAGKGDSTSNPGATAIGFNAQAIGSYSVALGSNSTSTTANGMALGNKANVSGGGGMALGNSANVSVFGGISLGSSASVDVGYGGMALGGSTHVTVSGGVALGLGSQLTTYYLQSGYLSNSKKANQADYVWKPTTGAISLGGDFQTSKEIIHYTRQIVNLAAGTQDTDAVNVAQLKAVEQEGISLTGNDNQTITQSLKNNNFTITGGLTGDDLQSASTANLGVRKNAAGNGLEVVMTTAPSFNQITVKNSSTADGASDISITGTGLSMGGKKITSLAAGSEADDAATYGQVSAISTDLSAFEAKTISVSGNEGSLSRKLGDSPIQIKGAGSKDNENYSGTNLKTYVDSNGALQILLDKELLEDRIDVGSALANPTDSRVNYPVVLGTDATDTTIGYVGINGRNGTSAVITSYAGSPIPGSDFNYTDSEGKSRMTRLEYTDQEGHAHHLATLTDGLTFGGDNSQVQIDSDSGTVSGTNVISRKLRATEYGKNNTTTNYLQIKGGADANKLSNGNIGVQASSDDGSLTIKLSQELKDLTSAQFGTTTINGSGLILGNTGISLTSSGLNNGEQKITNVKAGDISSTSTDAIIGSQLANILNADGSAKGISFGADSAAGSHTNPTSVAIGGTVTLKGAGGDSSHKNLSTQVTDKGELTVAMASEIQENKIYVGNQISQESSPTGKVNYPVILGENTVGTDTYGYVGIKGKNNSQLYLTADKDTSNNTRLDYLDANNNAHLVALTSDGYTFAGDVGTSNTLALNSTLSITGGIKDTGNLTTGNIGVVSSGKGGLTVQLAKSLKGLTDATFNSGAAQTKIDANGVTAPAYKVGTKTYIDSQGLHANDQKVTAVQAGNLSVDSTDAVNGSQLFATNQNVTTNTTKISSLTTRLDGAGMTFAGDSGSTTVTLNGTLHVNGADSNLTVTGDTGGLTLGLAKNLMGLNGLNVVGSDFTLSVTGDGLAISPVETGDGKQPLRFSATEGVDLGNRKITDLAAGTIGAGSTEAVNGSQLYTVQEAASQAQAEAQKHTTVSVGDNNLVLTPTAESNTAGADYSLKLNNKITLGTGDNQVVLDGSDTGTSSFGKQITLNGATGAVGVTSLTANGAVSASSVTVGDIILHSAADSTANPKVMKDTITGLGNTTYDEKNLVNNRAATEGQLQSLVSQINAGKISAGSTNVVGSSNISISDSISGKVTTYTASLTPALTGLTSAVFTNGQTGQDEETNTLTSDGLSLGKDIGAARFTRSGISAGSQQVKNLGSGITGTDGTVTTYDTTVTGQADYNNAASIGDVHKLVQEKAGVGTNITGNNSTQASLTLGGTISFKGAEVPLEATESLTDKLTNDYSSANVATQVSGSDGNVITTLYLKKDLVGRSLTLGTIGSDGNVANSDRTASLYQAQDDTAMVGHLFLAGEKRTKTAGNPTITHTSVDLYVKDGAEGDKGDLKDPELPVTRIYYTDEGNDTYALATMKDGLHVAGDSGNTSDLFLNQTLKLTGTGTAQTGYTSGNIGIYSNGNGTLDVQLADTLTGLKQISFADSKVSIGQNGINAGGKQIANVASGLPAGTALKDAADTVLQNAANIGDVKNAAAAASAEVKAGNNVNVTSGTSDKDGHTIYTVAANFNGADVRGSNAVVYDSKDRNQVTLGGSSSAAPVKLTHLAKGDISSTSTDAVTGKQLNEVIAYRDQTINVTGSTGSAVKLNHGNTLTISGDSNISTSSSGSDKARDGSLQVSLADNVYLQGIHIGSSYPTHSDTSVDSVALTADANNQTGILTLRGDATHVSDAYHRAQADISVLSAAPDQTYAAAPFLQEVYQTSNSGIITQNQPVRLAYRDNYSTAHQVATLDDGYVFSGDNGDKNLTEKLNGTVALRGMDNAHASQITSDTANTYLTKNNIGVVTKPKVLNEDGSTQGGEVEIRLAKDLTGLSSATFTNDNGDTAVIDAKNLKLTLNAQTEGKSPVSLTSNGLDNGKNKITNVADGTSDLDAVNYGQIKSIINSGDGKIKGLTFAAGDNTSSTVHLGDTLKIAGATDTDGAQNIHTTIKDDGTLTLQLDRKVQVDELHVGQKNSDVASLTAVPLDGNAGSIGQLYLKGINGAQAAVFTTMGSPSLSSTNQNTTTRLVYSNGMAGNIQHEIATLEDGLKFTGDNYTAASGEKAEQNVVKTQLNQTLHITGGQTDTQQLTTLEDKNIGVVAENGGLSVRLSKVLDGMTDIYMGDTRENSSHLTKMGLYLSPKNSTDFAVRFTADDGISAGSQPISNVADGVNDSDAATYGQLRKIEDKASVATKLTVNHGQPNGNLILTDTPDKDGIHHTYDVALSDKVTVGSTGNSITLDGNANTINGGSYVQFGGQTSDTGDVIANPLSIGWQSAGLQDVLTDQDKGSQTGNYLTGLSNTRWDPMNVGYSPSRAATEGQLKDLESRISNNMEVKQVTVSGVNDNITVTPAADNPNHYQVKLSDTLKLGQDAKVTIDGNNGTITGLTNKTIDAPGFATQGRAATEEQLKQVADSVGNLDKAASKTDFQLVGEKDKDGNYTGDYKVSDDNKVKLHVQDKMHPDQVKDITIDNVAKASDIGDVSQISEDIQNKEHNTVVDSLNKLNEKVKDAANGSWESQIDGKAVKKIKAGDVQNFTSGDNIQLSNDNGAIKIAAKKDVSFDKVTIGSGDSQMTLDKDGLQTGKVKVSHSEINAGGNQIHGVADGTKEDDAATVGQVDTKVNEVNTKVDKVADAAGTAINTLGNHINRLERRINKVGAGAAALAALHPDPNSDDDLSFAAGIGNYRGSTAAALGAFYRPSDNVTVSMGATIGNGENMVNAGVTIGVGEGVGRNPSTRKAMAKEISQLKEANAAKDAEVRDLKKQVQTLQKQNEDTQEKLKRIMEKLGI